MGGRVGYGSLRSSGLVLSSFFLENAYVSSCTMSLEQPFFSPMTNASHKKKCLQESETPRHQTDNRGSWVDDAWDQ